MAIEIIGFTDEKDFISLSPDQVEDILGYFLKPGGGPDEYISGDGTVKPFPSSWHWNNVTGKPDTATRWPTWEEVTNKPAAAEPMVNSVSNIIDGNQIHRAALVGDVTAGLNSNTTSIANNVVTNTKLAQVPTGVLKGRVASGTGNVQDLTADVVRSLLNVEDGATAGAAWATNLTGIPANITAWASVAPSAKQDTLGFTPVSPSLAITAGNGLSGGGTLAANRTITLGTPGTVTLSSSNSVSTTSHTHAFTPGGSTSQYIRGDGSLATFPSIPNTSDFISQPGSSWWTDVTSSASQGSIALRFEAGGNTRYFGMGSDGTLRTSTTSQFSTGDMILTTGNFDPSTLVERSIPALDPVGEVGDNGSNYGMALQPFRIGKSSSAGAPSFFGTNASPYLWLGSSGSSSQQGALLGVYASSVNSSRELAFRGRSGSGWSDWARVWHDGNFDPDSKAPVANPVFEGDLTVSTSSALGGVVVERRNNSVNASIEYKTSAGSIWAGYGNTGASFNIGGGSNLTASATWFSAADGAAYVYQGSSPREVWHAGNFNPASKADSSRLTWVGSSSGGVYADHLPANLGLSYMYHAAGNSPSDAPASPARQTAVLGMDTSWGQVQLAITNETVPQVFTRGSGGTAWTRIWTDASFDPTAKVDTSRTITAGNGLSGGGSLAANRTITLGTPGTITATSTNSVSSTSHTHNLDTTGNFTWTGDHTFIGDMIARSGSASRQLTIERTGNSINAAAAYTTTGGTIYAGQGDSGYFNWGSGTDLRYTNANSWGRIGSGGLEVKGKVEAAGIVSSSNAYIRGGSSAAIFSFNGTTTGSTIYFRPRGDTSSTNQTVIDWDGSMTVGGSISDSTGDVRKLRFITRNAATTLAASHLNGVVEKSNTTSYIYTIPAGLGSQGDAITFVNSGTGGNLTISCGTNVSLYRNGTNANIVVSPGSMITIYRSATNNRWIA